MKSLNVHGLRALTLACAMLLSAPVHALLIDSFNSTLQVVMQYGSAGTQTLTGAAAEALGGNRTLEVTLERGTGRVTLASLGPSGGTLAYSSDALTDGRGRVRWDSGGSGLGGVDLTDGGAASFFEVSVVDIDLNFDLSVEITDVVNQQAQVTVPDPGTGIVMIGLSDFVGVDLTHVEAVVLGLDGMSAADLEFDWVRTGAWVPEPASPWLLAGGALAHAALRRRQARTRGRPGPGG